MKENVTNSDADLMQKLQQGNKDALACLLKVYYDNLYNYGWRFSKDDALIKDCIQEVFISLWQRRETANSILSPKYYLLRATKNKVLKALHKNMRMASTNHLQDEYEFSYEFSVERIIIDKQMSDEKAEKLRKTLSLLSKRQREIIYLKYYQYLDHAQIAELMNISRQSVYNLLHETINKLRSLWRTEFAH